jgi:hypothetical protein
VSSRLVETHTATLLFEGDRVYKRKKPLDLGFLDFRSLAARRTACEEEVRLNRRLAPDVYLGVDEVLGDDGTPCDYVVVMRALPAHRSLAQLVRDGADVTATLVDVATRLAALHQASPAPAHLHDLGTAAAHTQLWDVGLDALLAFEDLVPAAVRERTRSLAHQWFAGREPLLARRLANGRLVDGHGDLQAEDVFVLDDGPRLLDCLEFDERLRVGDGLADAAFLAMDLERLGAPTAAARFLDAYRAAAADDGPPSLADAFVAYRAHVRSKVACIRARQDPDGDAAAQARLLADLALAHLERATVRLVLVGGLPGSGKTTVATALAATPGRVRLSSDVTRKQRAGVPLQQRADDALYDRATTDATYAALLAQARPLLAQGVSVVLDATFADPRHRQDARALAAASAATCVELVCRLPDAAAEHRLAVRAPGPSDATPQVRRELAGRFGAWPEAVALDTSLPLDRTVAQARATWDVPTAGPSDPVQSGVAGRGWAAPDS